MNFHPMHIRNPAERKHSKFMMNNVQKSERFIDLDQLNHRTEEDGRKMKEIKMEIEKYGNLGRKNRI